MSGARITCRPLVQEDRCVDTWAIELGVWVPRDLFCQSPRGFTAAQAMLAACLRSEAIREPHPLCAVGAYAETPRGKRRVRALVREVEALIEDADEIIEGDAEKFVLGLVDAWKCGR